MKTDAVLKATQLVQKALLNTYQNTQDFTDIGPIADLNRSIIVYIETGNDSELKEFGALVTSILTDENVDIDTFEF